MGTVNPTSSSATRCTVVKVVPSVGPYPLRRMPPLLTLSLTRPTDSTSPPASTCLTPLSASGWYACICSKRAAVSHSDVTPASFSLRPSASNSSGPSGYTTSFPPCSSAPHTSNVDASKPVGANCSHTSSGPKSATPPPNTSRVTARCGTATPFGFPVLPDVNITYARWPPPTRAPGFVSGCLAICVSHSVSTHTTNSLPDATSSASFSCATSSATPASRFIHPSRSSG
ncbi:hypothetical protein MYXA107069_16760 [Myxococcus xanthus]